VRRTGDAVEERRWVSRNREAEPACWAALRYAGWTVPAPGGESHGAESATRKNRTLDPVVDLDDSRPWPGIGNPDGYERPKVVSLFTCASTVPFAPIATFVLLVT